MTPVQQLLFDNFCQHCGENLLKPEKRKRGRPSSSIPEKQLITREKALRHKIYNEYNQKITVLRDQNRENISTISSLRNENRDLLREIRSLSGLQEKMELQIEQELFNKEQIIRAEITSRLESQYEIREKELTKKIDDTKRTVATLDAQVNERSSRLMGESLELSLHEQLVKFFPDDTIKEIKVGARGADIEQIVNDSKGNICGKLLWEAKNAKWQTAWVKKLQGDIIESDSDVGIIVGTKLQDNNEFLTLGENIFACSPFAVHAVANVARMALILTHRTRKISEKAERNAQDFVNYFSGKAFGRRLGEIVASAKLQRSHIDAERAFFQKKWASQEVDIASQFTVVSGLSGELSALLGVCVDEIASTNSSEA
jgi:hypothetical protein